MHVFVPSLWVWNVCGIIFGLELYKDANIGTFFELNALDGWDVYNGRGKKQQENILNQLTTRTTQGENQG
jgi:hypothetical protein